MSHPVDVTGPDDLDRAAAQFAALRPRLFGIAYRVLGSWAEAEDAVQETWLRWHGYDRATVRDPGAFLATTVTRLAINAATSARARRETYIGPWLPEPVSTADDPALGAERADALEFAVLILLEKLTPAERAAYVLREAFDYPYGQIAGILELAEPNVRQLVSRARKHLAAGRVRPVPADERTALLQTFVTAARTGDLEGLESLLAADVINWSDGGGVVRAARIAVAGRTKVARFIRAFADQFWPHVQARLVQINGQSAVLISNDGGPVAVLTIAVSERGIEQVFWQMNPEKMGGLAAL